jgi:methylenetetrahydrofolate dehydrogenase (NADP+)/methenyltetrahydrofolate cyclohydrolase
MGRAAMLTRNYIKPGAVVMDVGTTKYRIERPSNDCLGNDEARWRDFNKRGYIWVGDVDERSVMEVASKMTVVPGGVGP